MSYFSFWYNCSPDIDFIRHGDFVNLFQWSSIQFNLILAMKFLLGWSHRQKLAACTAYALHQMEIHQSLSDS